MCRLATMACPALSSHVPLDIMLVGCPRAGRLRSRLDRGGGAWISRAGGALAFSRRLWNSLVPLLKQQRRRARLVRGGDVSVPPFRARRSRSHRHQGSLDAGRFRRQLERGGEARMSRERRPRLFTRAFCNSRAWRLEHDGAEPGSSEAATSRCFG